MTNPLPAHESGGPPSAGFALVDRIEALRPIASQRLSLRLSSLLAVGGTLIAAVGLLAAAEELAGAGLVAFVALVITGGGIAGLVLFKWGPLATSGVTALLVGSLVLVGSVSDSSGALAVMVWCMVVAGLLALYALGPWAGHSALVVPALYTGWAAMVWITSQASDRPGSIIDQAIDAVLVTSMASLLVAMAYFVAGYLLDRKGWVGLATVFVGVGHLALWSVFFLIAAAAGLLVDDVVGGGGSVGPGLLIVGLFVVLVGLLLMAYGAAAQRRFTAWSGAIVAPAGFVVMAVAVLPDGTGAAFGSIVFALVGGGVVVAAWFLARVLDEPDERDPAPSFSEVNLPATFAAIASGVSSAAATSGSHHGGGDAPAPGGGPPAGAPYGAPPHGAPGHPPQPFAPPDYGQVPTAPTAGHGAAPAAGGGLPPITLNPAPAAAPAVPPHMPTVPPATEPPAPGPSSAPEGWWQADATGADATTPVPAPAADDTSEIPPGWWQASDGNWYPPELHPG
ncbi:MAG: hypothetical protein JJU45_05600 [Acidimicrobiia bacterium]|nr:hypothetical protein [Acidimicrobiia bacterium]